MLAFAQRRRAAAQRAEIDVLEAALVWAAMHPEESVSTSSTDGSAGLVFGELTVPLAGEGAPLVAEFAPMEFGAALGMSTDGARALVGDALELAHRLKRTWKLVRIGKVPLWKARRLAQLTTGLPMDGAEFVDRQLAAFVGKISWAAVERLVDQARVAYDPEGAEKERLAGAQQLPGPLQPVGQLERVTDQGPRAVGRQTQRGTELHRRELRDQRRPLARERNGEFSEHQVPGTVSQARRNRLLRVHRRPHQGRLQDVDLRPLGGSPTALRERQHGGWGVAVGELEVGHASFYSNARSR